MKYMDGMAIFACVAAFGTHSIVRHNVCYYAPTDRTFKAAVVGIALTRHKGFECSAGVHQPAENVIRVVFDRDVQIYSENGTGEGYYFRTRSVDLPFELSTDPQKLAFLFGKDAMTFHYSGSFLSVCDESHIPIIRGFTAE